MPIKPASNLKIPPFVSDPFHELLEAKLTSYAFKERIFFNQQLKQLVDSLADEVMSFYRIKVYNKLLFVCVPEIDLENKALCIKQIDIFSPEENYLYKAHLNFGQNRQHLSSPGQNIDIKRDFLNAVLQDENCNVLIARSSILPEIEQFHFRLQRRFLKIGLFS